MKLKFVLISIVIVAVINSAFADKKVSDSEKPSTIGNLISGKIPFSKEKILGSVLISALKNMHFEKKDIDDDLSEKAYKLFLERVDYTKQFLVRGDVQKLSSFEEEMDDELKSGKLKLADAAEVIMVERIKWLEPQVTKILSSKIDYDKDESYETDSEKRDYARDKKALVERWRKMIKFDVISQYIDLKNDQDGKNVDKDKKKSKKKLTKKKEKKLSEKQLKTKALDKVKKRYTKIFKRLQKRRSSDKMDRFYNSITKVFDPHTNYLVPDDKEDFDIEMSGKLEGIGALLREEGSYIKVERIIPGSASWKGKQLKAEDTILAVGQGDEDPVDIVDMGIRDAVKLIRGKKGTIVKLKVKRPDGTKKIIPITRDKVVIEASYVKSSVLTDSKHGIKIGYINVPKFYRDFNDPKGRKCSEDVKNELIKLKKQKVEAVILDLRNNGGGALPDATIMGGLFIDSGPIVQVKGYSGNKDILSDDDGKSYFDGPVVVMVNRFSASASEIVAAALQDYKRAIIVGEGNRTHGKGTVQAVINFDEYVSPVASVYKPFGALKITIQMFYRINGGSTQFRGVVPDISLPDMFAYTDSGEESLDYAIPYQEIDKVNYNVWSKQKYDISNLRRASEKRVAKSKSYQKINKSIEWYKERKEKTKRDISLKSMVSYNDMVLKKMEELKSDHKTEGLKIKVNQKALDDADKERIAEYSESLEKDMALEETLNIINDMMKQVKK